MSKPVMMFTPKRPRLLIFALLAATLALVGCEKSLDSPEYGEIIDQVPRELDRPYPLPELDAPGPSPLPGPAEVESEPGEPFPEENER